MPVGREGTTEQLEEVGYETPQMPGEVLPQIVDNLKSKPLLEGCRCRCCPIGGEQRRLIRKRHLKQRQNATIMCDG